MKLEGKVAIITGAGDGIGRATAIKFAEEGASSFLIDVNAESLDEVVSKIRGLNRKSIGMVQDIADPDAPSLIIKQALEKFSTFDILINNAGVGGSASILELPDTMLDRVLAVNFTAPFLLTKYASEHWINQKKPGCIINTASINAEYVQANSTAYCASKGAVRMLTKAAAMDLGEFGITVNSVGPGHTRTGLTRDTEINRPAVVDEWIRQTPLARLGEPEDIANAILFLSSESGSYITGQTIYIDGGRTAHYP